MADTLPSTVPGRLARLDGLRGLAAMVVVFYHCRLMFAEGVFASAGPIVGWLHGWGWAFVDLFFLISGYIFAHVYGQAGALSGGRALADFAVARFARLYPLHIVMLVVTAFLFAGKPGSDAAAFGAHLLMAQAFVRPFADTFDGPSWSLTIECLCYAVFAAAAFAGPRVLAALTLAAVVWAAGTLALQGPPGGPWSGDLAPRGILGFFMGQALWRGRAICARIPAALLLAGLVAGLILAAGPLSPLVPLDLLGWPAALLLALRLPVMGGRVMLWLGDRSYGIYLMHMPLLEFVTKRFGPFEGGFAAVAALHLVVIAAVLVLADAALRRIEQPARRLIRAGWSAQLPARVGPA